MTVPADRPSNVRLRVTLVYEYETNPADYPDTDPAAMARFDIETDPAVVLDADWMVTEVSMRSPDAR